MSDSADKAIVFFDGHCKLCSGIVQFIIKNEPDGKLHFTSLQSDFAQNFIFNDNGTALNPTSIVFLEDGLEYYRSDAAIRIARYLSSPWRYLTYGGHMPKVLRDAIYNVVAQSRYTLFGRMESCMIPSPEIMSRFID